LPTQPRSITAPPLVERLRLACKVKGRIPYHQGTTRPPEADGKRPNGLSLTPWREGRCATWDVTIPDTVAALYLNNTASPASQAGSAAEAATSRKEEKYSEIAVQYNFFPLAFETFGPINQASCKFISSSGHHLSLVSDDPQETPFLFQCLSVTIQRFNLICICNPFGNLPF